MSYLNSSSFYPVDNFAFDYHLAMDQDSAPTRFLGDNSISFELPLFSGLESTTGASFPTDSPHVSMDTLNHQESSGLRVPHHDSIDSLEVTHQHIGILPPSVADYVPDTPQRFNGEIPTQDTYWKDIKRYTDKHGKLPHLSAFVQEDFGFRCVHIAKGAFQNPMLNASTFYFLPCRSGSATKKQVTFRDFVTVHDGHAVDGATKNNRRPQPLAHQTKFFVCTQPGCDKVYSHLGSLKRHMKTCRG